MRILFVCLIGLSGVAMFKRSVPAFADQDFSAACSGRIVNVMGESLREFHSGFGIQRGSHGDGSHEVQFSLSSRRGNNSRVNYRDINDDGIVDSMHGEWGSEAGLLPLSESYSRFIFVNSNIIPVQKSRGWHNYPTALDGTIYRFTNPTWEKSGVAPRRFLDLHTEALISPESKPREISAAIPSWVDIKSNQWHFSRTELDIPWSIERHHDAVNLKSVTLTQVDSVLRLSCSNDGGLLRLSIGEKLTVDAWYSEGFSNTPIRYEVRLGNYLYEDLDGDGIIDLIRERNGEHYTIRVGRSFVRDCIIGPDRCSAAIKGESASTYLFVDGDWISN